ncbi:MAG: nickel-dependent hydrogenase large subunit [Pirellulaceae bacterium]|nr:nickel-dependent hydrogenase large subunit [Pirellulaceae bacterium]
MSASETSARAIRVPILTRVEGEGSLLIKLRAREIVDVQLAIYEPPRLFESLLRGRPFADVADITARICGICPIAYQMTAVQALEAAFSVSVHPEIRSLRRLMYCGEWIESHALHVHLLQAPDFFGLDSGIELAERFPDEVKRGLRLKKIGNTLLETLGGRAIHPVNLAVGGYYRLPKAADLKALIADFEWGLEAAIDTVRWVSTIPLPSIELPYDYVAIQHPSEYGIIEGEVVCSDGLRIPHTAYEQHYAEVQVPHSTALQSRRIPSGSSYFVGPLARMNLNREQLAEPAKRIADEIDFPTPCFNAYYGILARSIEVVHAFAEGLDHLRSYRGREQARAAFQIKRGSGCAVTEAPRGLIYHRYEVDDQGRIELAKIVPPTSQNQAQVEQDLRAFLPSLLDESDAEIALSCERFVRNYDPCISCSTHFLNLRIERE